MQSEAIGVEGDGLSGKRGESIPVDTGAGRGAFVVFEVGKERRFDGYVEVVTLVRAYRDKGCAHSEAMQVA